MENKGFDRIVFRLGLVFEVLAVFCMIISRGRAEFIISVASAVISLCVVVISGLRIRKDNKKG